METLEEIANRMGLSLLREGVSYKVPLEKLEIFPKSKLVESSEGNFSARGVLYQVPVTRFVENLNNRIYPRELWERIQKEELFNTRLCLADHANDSGSVRNIAGVWHNFQVLDETGVADLYCVGDYGDLLLEVAKAGGNVGFSTVGFGEFLEDGRTVNPETFLPGDSACDWVMNPSQQVYGTHRHLNSEQSYKQPELTNPVKESGKQVEVTVSSVEETTNQNKDELSETIVMNETQKLLEANYINQANKLIEEASETNDPAKSRKEIKSFVATLPETEGLKETRFSLVKSLEDLDKKLHETLKTKDSELQEKTTSYQELAQKHETLKQSYNDLAEQYETLTGLASRLKETLDASKEKDLQGSSLKEKKMATLLENEKKRQADVNRMLEETVVRERDLKNLCGLIERMAKDLKGTGKYTKKRYPEMVHYRGFQPSVIREEGENGEEYAAMMAHGKAMMAHDKAMASHKAMMSHGDNPELGVTPHDTPKMDYEGANTYMPGNDEPELGGTGFMGHDDEMAMKAYKAHMDHEDEVAMKSYKSHMDYAEPEAMMGHKAAKNHAFMPMDDEPAMMDYEEPAMKKHGYMDHEDEAMMGHGEEYSAMDHMDPSGKDSNQMDYYESRKGGKRVRKESVDADPVIRKYYEEAVEKKPILESIKGDILGASSIVQAVKLAEDFLKKDKETPTSLKEGTSITSLGNKKPEWIGNKRW